MKKFVSLLMVLVMVLAFAACGSQGGDTAPLRIHDGVQT